MLETFTETENWVFHMEVDLSTGEILFTDDNALRITVGNTTMTLVGVPTSPGYRNDIGRRARFNEITGFAQINHTSVIVSDSFNHCLRIVDRQSHSAEIFAGVCTKNGNQDGLNALFNFPYAVLLDAESELLYVTSSGNNALCSVNIDTRYVTTLVSNNLPYPSAMSFDWARTSIRLSVEHSIANYAIRDGVVTSTTGWVDPGLSDGALATARFSDPREIAQLSENIFLIADKDNHLLRIVDLQSETITSICSGLKETTDGDTNDCALNYPLSFLYTNGSLYVGQAYAIRQISGRWSHVLHVCGYYCSPLILMK